MTAKDFRLIAGVINELDLDHAPEHAQRAQRARIAMSFGTRLAEENPKFDPTRFMNACGVEGNYEFTDMAHTRFAAA